MKNLKELLFDSGEVLTVSLIGLGNQGKYYHHALDDLRQEGVVDYIGVCDKNAKVLENDSVDVFKTTSIDELLEYRKPKIALLCLPNKYYSPIIARCLKSGISVLKEKPLALNLAQARGFHKLAVENDQIINVCQTKYHWGALTAATAWLEELPHPNYISYEFRLSGKDNRWYWDAEEGGGSWLGLGWHACTVLSLILKGARLCFSKHTNIGNMEFQYAVEDTSLFTLVDDQDCMAQGLVCSVDIDKSESIKIIGKNYYIDVDKENCRLRNQNGDVTDHQMFSKDNSIYQKEVVRFLTQYLDRQQYSADFKRQLKIQALVDDGSPKNIQNNINVNKSALSLMKV